MGTRINVLFAHQLSNWRCREETLEVLSKTTPSIQAVEDYWHSVNASHFSDVEFWIAEPLSPQESRDYLRYTGPGRSFFASVNPSCVWIHTGGRWRGFLGIPELRKVHLRAFRDIAVAFNAKEFYCFPDNDLSKDEFWFGHGLEECLAVLHSQLGEPIQMHEMIDHKVAKSAEHGCPQFWYRNELI